MNFLPIYKKIFKQRLAPNGYSFRKNIFYNNTSDDICLFISVYKEKSFPSMPGMIRIYVDVQPYCADLRARKYDPQESGYELLKLIMFLMPNKITEAYLKERLFAEDDETALISLNLICDDLQNIIFPYINKFNDLDFFYSEMINMSSHQPHLIGNISYNDEFFGLSLKLHKYETAIPYIENKETWHNDVIVKNKSDLEELKNGNIDIFIQNKIKKDKNFLKEFMAAIEKDITASETETAKLHVIKEAILANNHSFIDNFVEEIEKNSREYIREMLTS